MVEQQQKKREKRVIFGPAYMMVQVYRSLHAVNVIVLL